MEYKVKILVDRREDRSGIVDLLKGFNLEVMVQTLAIGDYFIGGRVLIERKTAEDFKSSIISGRLFQQVFSLKKWNDKSALIIEGDLSDIKGIDQNALQGAIISISVFWQLPILFSRDSAESAKLLYIIALQSNRYSDKKAYRHYPKKKPVVDIKYGQKMLEAIPYVGPLTAKNLLYRFGSIENVVKSSELELSEVGGVGITKARIIKNIFSNNTGGLNYPKSIT